MEKRIDQLLVERGFFVSRERARAAIMAGSVRVDGKTVDKAGQRVSPDRHIEVLEKDSPFVSRGGLKLAHALAVCGVRVAGKICLDVGASTGGFTDCLLKSGAARVYAVDVGYGQLDWSLRMDPRVVVMERTNARYLKPEQVSERPQLVCIDVSFISIRMILPAVLGLIASPAQIVALVKPQFEAGRNRVGKKGVVRSPEVHVEVLHDVLAFGRERGLACTGLTYSPVQGPEGNIEFLVLWQYGSVAEEAEPEAVEVVREAHQHFGAARA